MSQYHAIIGLINDRLLSLRNEIKEEDDMDSWYSGYLIGAREQLIYLKEDIEKLIKEDKK